MGIDVSKAETAAMDALSKVSKPSWKSATWWLGTAATVWGCVIAAGLIGPGTPLALIVGSAMALASVLAAHAKDGWIKTAIAAAPDAWNLIKTVRGGAALSAVAPHYDSTAPARFVPSVSGGVPQALDAEDPK